MIIISIHIFPFEMRRFERLVHNLNNCMEYLNPYDILLHITLNTNDRILIKDKHEHQSVQEFNKIIKQIKFKNISHIKSQPEFLGVNEHRRQTIEIASNSDYIIFLDSDVYFNKTILAHHINSIHTLSEKHKYFIISPCTIKLWDNTWDIITHQDYIEKPNDFYLKADYYNIVNKNYGQVSLKKINKFKWGGGWFNCISASLLKKVGIPKSFVGYGPDDTFVMECCKLMKRDGENIQQYLLNNMVVCEDIPIGRHHFKKNIPNFRELCNKKFRSELLEFNKRYKKETN
jgi:hypothetical protein